MTKRKITLVDVDTQFDFMHPEGNLYVPQAETLSDNFKSLIAFAQSQDIPIIASVDAHDKDDPEFKQFPPHCVKGTAGQKKVDETAIEDALVIENAPLSLDLSQTRAVVLEKVIFSLFGNPNADAVLNHFEAEEFVVFGLATDYCVKAAALGLRERGHKVSLVTDAIKAVTLEGEQSALAEMKSAGVKFISTQEVINR